MIYKLNFPCSRDQLVKVRMFLNDVLSKHSIPDKEKNAMVLAVDEICANLIIHAHNCNPSETILLTVKVEEKKGITFEIQDHGDGFDIRDYKEPLIKDIVRQRRKGGIGLMLVRRIMDDVDMIRENGKNTYRLYKKI
jgi:serine/threonine-protein kinase RsbW